MFRLAHISDLHIGPLPPVGPRQLLNKRVLGYLSWRTRKQRVHRVEVLDALRRDLRAMAPDHVVITGDLVNLALPAEFVQAAVWLRELGSPDWISVVPGNHDAYVQISYGESLAHWVDYMRSDDDLGRPARSISSGFPYLRRRGPLAIVGLSTAIATRPGLATGRLGEAQLEALDRLLEDLMSERSCRVVLLHHPPLADASGWRKRLIDAPAFRRIVAYRGADLILHGHRHRPICGALQGDCGPIPVEGATSASASTLPGHPERHARYQIYGIQELAGGWVIDHHTRSYNPTAGSFVSLPAPVQCGLANREVTRPC